MREKPEAHIQAATKRKNIMYTNVRVFFKKGIEKCSTFQRPLKEGEQTLSASVCNGVVPLRVSTSGRWFTDLNDGQIHPKLFGFVDEVSIHHYFNLINQGLGREAGIYQHNTARGEVEERHVGNVKTLEQRQIIKITGQMSDCMELLHLIRAGAIRPVESYEGNQVGMSKAELYSRTKEYKAVLETIRCILIEADKLG